MRTALTRGAGHVDLAVPPALSDRLLEARFLEAKGSNKKEGTSTVNSQTISNCEGVPRRRGREMSWRRSRVE
jgi:hypothetical protein